MNGIVARGTDSAKVVQVIETVSSRGKGTDEDPCRVVHQYWSLEGELLAENDPCEGEKMLEADTEKRAPEQDSSPNLNFCAGTNPANDDDYYRNIPRTR